MKPIENEKVLCYDYVDETPYQYWSLVYPWSGLIVKVISTKIMNPKCLLLQIFNIAYELALNNISHNDIHKGNLLIQSAKDLMRCEDSLIRIRYTYQNELSLE